MPETTPTPRRYSFLGPAGTFTEAALRQVPEAQGQEWAPVANIGEALNDVITGASDAAMIAIENSVDGGVTVAQDDYLIADRCGTVFVPAARIDEVLDLGERIARRQDGMVRAILAGRSVEEVMHDKEFEAIAVKR